MTEELLSRRELAVKTMEETYEQRLKNELSRYFPLYSVAGLYIIICHQRSMQLMNICSGISSR